MEFEGRHIGEKDTSPYKTKHVILITLDGVRVKEMFGGLDVELLEGKRADDPLYKKWWAPTAEERREKLMPFFWNTLMKHGSIAGHREMGSTVELTNTHRFSYPGYAELLLGVAHDKEINSNNGTQNPYKTVLEFIKEEKQLKKEQVAAFASWDILQWIVEKTPGTITANAGQRAYEHKHLDPKIEQLVELQLETLTPWDIRHDIFTHKLAMFHLKTFTPRMLYISYGETDDWAHDARYDRVLSSLNQTDRFLKEIWEFVQDNEEYRDKTTIIITTDHGRGNSDEWPDHESWVEGAQYIWQAFISPDSSLRGVWKSSETLYMNQIAATICKLLNLDHTKYNPKAGKPIERLFM